VDLDDLLAIVRAADFEEIESARNAVDAAALAVFATSWVEQEAASNNTTIPKPNHALPFTRLVSIRGITLLLSPLELNLRRTPMVETAVRCRRL